MSSIKWITDTVEGYLFPSYSLPELTGSHQVTDQQIYSPDTDGSQQLTVLTDTGYQNWINFEVTGCDRMEVDYEHQRGVKRLLDDDDEIWSITRKQPMIPESKRIRLCCDSRARPFVSKWNRKAKQMRKLRRRRRVNVPKSVIPMEMKLVEPISIYIPLPEEKMMPVLQHQQSIDVVLVNENIVPRDRKQHVNTNSQRSKNKIGAIYSAKASEKKGTNRRH
jgi:hypothetical protein